MKKLLLLFIPLMIFFSCENEEEVSQEEDVDCFCGEILQIEEGNPFPWPGGMQYVPELSDSVYIEPYDGYQFFEITNYCSGNIAAGCYDWIVGSDPVSVGDTYCMEWSNYVWGSFVSLIDGNLVVSEGCIGDSIVPFNEF